MPDFLNIHKQPVTIYFGDLAPATTIYQDKINDHVYIGTHDYGRFSKKVYQQIVESWETYKETHEWNDDRYRWYGKTL